MKIELKQESRWLDSDLETVIGLFMERLGGGDGLLLESVAVDGRWGRYSLAAGDFLLAASAKAGRLELKVFDERLKSLTGLSGRPFFEGLAELTAALNLAPAEDTVSGPPITRALYGWLGPGTAGLGGPADADEEGVFVLPGTVYLFDHPYNQLLQLSLLPGTAAGPPPLGPRPNGVGPLKASWDKGGYLAAASTIMDKIRLGQVREVSLAARFSSDFNGDLFSAYRRLRRLSPSAYMVFLRLGDFSLAVSSPESMITCERNKLSLSPMAGSRTQGRGLAEDNLFEDELLSDSRELTRHLTLLNQGREELLQVAAPGSIQVERFMERERFENLRRLTSRLAATVADGRSGVDVLKTLFPAGAVIGAPKAEALRLIGELEPEPRGPYGGAVGWLGLDQSEVNLDFGLTTQGCWARGGRAFWAVGGPLTEETDPENVWREIAFRAEAARNLLEPETVVRLAPAAVPTATPRPLAAAVPADTPEMAPRLPVLMENLAAHVNLSRAEAAHLFARLMDGELSQAQAGALLMGLKAKGETPEELAEAAQAVLDRAVSLPPIPGPFLDIVGTGGDNRYTFNCSTAAALTMAGLGYKVVKHGNRSISSKSGSADVLERLGEDLNRPPEEVPGLLARRNFVFLFAPSYHPSFRHIMPVRKELGIRTLFNILGPLVNPARPDYSFLGAPNRAILPLMAGAQRLLGTKFTALVCGAGDYDELTALGPAAVILVEGDKITETTIDPARHGFTPCDPRALTISGPAEGEKVLRELLAGRGPAPMRDMLILNVALAIYVVRVAESFDRCLNEARRAVESGAGGRVLPSA
ncbi:MAG: anthranilate phosphoribosyltransferase [Candidatus Adiutrix sp.]|jgi:anthranilate synthase component 1|nr:anthranilate phosphoribosyltransferase [Candidatus Adiutrix sp.]